LSNSDADNDGGEGKWKERKDCFQIKHPEHIVIGNLLAPIYLNRAQFC